jgi:hypothetical protein
MKHAVLERPKESDSVPRIQYDVSEQTTESICQTCIHRRTCMYYKDRKYPIVFCEEFGTAEGTKAQKKSVNNRSMHETQPDLSLGLCANCENRFHCVHAHSEGGIWHCEEYR